MTERANLIERLEKRIADQREKGGDMMDYGRPDPLDVDLLAYVRTSIREADNPTIQRLVDACALKFGSAGHD